MIDPNTLTNAAGLTMAASAVITFLMILVPPLRTRFSALDADSQRAINGFVVLGVAAAATLASCFKIIEIIPCTQQSIIGYATTVAASAVLGLGVTKAEYGVAKLLMKPKRSNLERSAGPAPVAASAKLLG